ADCVFAGDGRENIDALSARGAGEVALEAYDFIYAYALGGGNFVARNGGTFRDIACRDCNAELAQGFNQRLLDAFQLRRISRRPTIRIVRIEQIQAGHDVTARVPVLSR